MTPEETLARMELAADCFYRQATASEYYPFIKFSALMNEYIKVCRENLARGVDFREVSGPSSQRMELQPYEIDCFNQALNCIFQGLIKVEGVNNDGG